MRHDVGASLASLEEVLPILDWHRFTVLRLYATVKDVTLEAQDPVAERYQRCRLVAVDQRHEVLVVAELVER